MNSDEVRTQTSKLVKQLRLSEDPAEWRRLSTELVPLLIAYWDVHPHSAMEMLQSTVNNLPVNLANPLVRSVVRDWQKRPSYDPEAGGSADHCYLAALILSENYDLAEPEWAARVLPRMPKDVRSGTRDEERKRGLIVALGGD
jgi:hypothetical protein